MRHVYDLQSTPGGDVSDKTQVGRQNNHFYGFGYRYVMPQVGAWVNTAGPDYPGGFTCPPGGAPSFSYISLDRSTVPDRLITGQYCDSGDPGSVAAWPLNGADGSLLPSSDGHVHATAAYRLPQIVGGSHVQRAAASNGTWYLSRSRGASTDGQLLVAKPDGDATGSLTVTDQRDAAIGPEDLSLWPSRRQVWSVSEHAGRRMLYATGM